MYIFNRVKKKQLNNNEDFFTFVIFYLDTSQAIDILCLIGLHSFL